MPRIGIFYGSTTGNTEEVVNMLAGRLTEHGFEVVIHDIVRQELEDMMHYDNLILASPTWNMGELQEDWEVVFEEFSRLDFTGKKVAFLGLGDQAGHSETFLNGIGLLARPVEKNGAEIVGMWPREDYEYENSEAERGEMFIGLAIDQDSEEDQTAERLDRWVTMITGQFGQ
nr:flavodoxin [candidate division Zixibacteria bacterium]